MSNSTTECSVNCGIGHQTTIVVSCNGTSEDDLNYQIDDSLECWTTSTKVSCKGGDSDCPGL